jgi:hypothetical protein
MRLVAGSNDLLTTYQETSKCAIMDKICGFNLFFMTKRQQKSYKL